MKKPDLKIALPVGRMLKVVLPFLGRAGLAFSDPGDSKRLSIPSADGSAEALLVRSSDVPAYVAHGAADLGIVGKDVLWETQESLDDLYELRDLGFGACRLVVASPGGKRPSAPVWRVATKYPRTAERIFAAAARPVEIIKLYGSVELAPITGIADVIVDLVETGSTLKANGLEIIDEIESSSARLVANRVAYKIRFAAVKAFLDRLDPLLA